MADLTLSVKPPVVNREICFRFEGFQEKLCNNLYSMWKASQLCDLTLKVSGGEIHAHSCLLAAFSPTIAGILSKVDGHFMERGEQSQKYLIIDVKKVNIHVMKAIVLSIYTGQLLISENLFEQLLDASKWLKMQDLVCVVAKAIEKRNKTLEQACVSEKRKSDEALPLCDDSLTKIENSLDTQETQKNFSQSSSSDDKSPSFKQMSTDIDHLNSTRKQSEVSESLSIVLCDDKEKGGYQVVITDGHDIAESPSLISSNEIVHSEKSSTISVSESNMGSSAALKHPHVEASEGRKGTRQRKKSQKWVESFLNNCLYAREKTFLDEVVTEIKVEPDDFPDSSQSSSYPFDNLMREGKENGWGIPVIKHKTHSNGVDEYMKMTLPGEEMNSCEASTSSMIVNNTDSVTDGNDFSTNTTTPYQIINKRSCKSESKSKTTSQFPKIRLESRRKTKVPISKKLSLYSSGMDAAYASLGGSSQLELRDSYGDEELLNNVMVNRKGRKRSRSNVAGLDELETDDEMGFSRVDLQSSSADGIVVASVKKEFVGKRQRKKAIKMEDLRTDDMRMAISGDNVTEKKKCGRSRKERVTEISDGGDSSSAVSIQIEELLTKLKDGESVKCIRCCLYFKDPDEYEKHITNHPIFSCPECPRKFYWRRTMTRHLYLDHLSGTFLQCSECPFVAKTTKELCQHSGNVHDQPKPFKCERPDCSFRSARYSRVQKHLHEIHGTQKDYVCEKCGAGFTYKGAYQQHQILCLKLQTHLCYVCGANFSMKQYLTNHIATVHLNIKKYRCHQCSHSFSYHSNLKRHMYIHDNVYPYTCLRCDKKFRHSSTYKLHMESQHKGDNLG